MHTFRVREKFKYHRSESTPQETIFIVQELFHLYQRSIIRILPDMSTGEPIRPQRWYDVRIDTVTNGEIGKSLYDLMSLTDIPQSHENEIYWYLKSTAFEEGHHLPPESFLAMNREELEQVQSKVSF